MAHHRPADVAAAINDLMTSRPLPVPPTSATACSPRWTCSTPIRRIGITPPWASRSRAIGIQVATAGSARARRDGAFQMTGMELGHCRRYGSTRSSSMSEERRGSIGGSPVDTGRPVGPCLPGKARFQLSMDAALALGCAPIARSPPYGIFRHESEAFSAPSFSSRRSTRRSRKRAPMPP
jgi:hypothetical protein